MTVAAGTSGAGAAVCRKYHVRELAVFGSAARGGMRKDSDIYLLGEFDPKAKVGWGFWLSQLFARKTDLRRKSSLKPRARPSELRGARVIYAA